MIRNLLYMKSLLTVIVSISLCNNLYSSELNSVESLIEQKRKIEFNMTKLRVKLLTENNELRKLNESIIRQQKVLMKKLDEQPEMQFFLNKLNNINEKLKKLN